jgi:hypothetical protein
MSRRRSRRHGLQRLARHRHGLPEHGPRRSSGPSARRSPGGISKMVVSRESCETTDGGGGIRTPGTVARPTPFKGAAFNHSATPPRADITGRPLDPTPALCAGWSTAESARPGDDRVEARNRSYSSAWRLASIAYGDDRDGPSTPTKSSTSLEPSADFVAPTACDRPRGGAPGSRRANGAEREAAELRSDRLPSDPIDRLSSVYL